MYFPSFHISETKTLWGVVGNECLSLESQSSVAMGQESVDLQKPKRDINGGHFSHNLNYFPLTPFFFFGNVLQQKSAINICPPFSFHSPFFFQSVYLFVCMERGRQARKTLANHEQCKKMPLCSLFQKKNSIPERRQYFLWEEQYRYTFFCGASAL